MDNIYIVKSELLQIFYEEVVNIFPFRIMKSLQSLQFLEQVDCNSSKEVFYMKWINVNEVVMVT